MEQFQRNMNMNVNIPPHPMINVTSSAWYEHERYHPTPPHDQRNIISVIWTMNVNIPPHPTPPHPIIKQKQKKTNKKTPRRQQNTQAPCSAHGNWFNGSKALSTVKMRLAQWQAVREVKPNEILEVLAGPGLGFSMLLWLVDVGGTKFY